MSIDRASTRRRTRAAFMAASLLVPVLVMLIVGGRAVAADTTWLVPDLSMMKPSDIQMQTTSSNRRLLRMSTSIVNIGAGPFETRSSRTSTSDPTMSVSQRIFNRSGGTRVHETSEVAKYAGDGHDHWHVQNIAEYAVYARTGGGPFLRKDSKVGFCFFDTNIYRPTLPGSPAGRQYFESGCGVPSSKFVKNGISVGWADKYPWNFAFQWIDVTGLPAGEYLLKLSADPDGQFEELVEGNNCNWTRIRIPASGTKVTIVASGWGCTLPGGDVPIPTGRVVIPPRP